MTIAGRILSRPKILPRELVCEVNLDHHGRSALGPAVFSMKVAYRDLAIKKQKSFCNMTRRPTYILSFRLHASSIIQITSNDIRFEQSRKRKKERKTERKKERKKERERERGRGSQPANQPTNQPASQPTSQPANQRTSEPASQPNE